MVFRVGSTHSWITGKWTLALALPGSNKPGRLGSSRPPDNEKRSLWLRFSFNQHSPNYLFLFEIMSWMIGARISSMAKPILAPGTTMVLRRDMKEFGIMFSR